jgi:hypothetical protein
LVDRLRLLSHMTGDRRWFSSLTPVMTKEYITFVDIGKGRVLSVGTVKVSESVTLQCVSLINLWVTIFSLFPIFLMRVLKSVSKRVVLVFWILEAISVHDRPRGSDFQS